MEEPINLTKPPVWFAGAIQEALKPILSRLDNINARIDNLEKRFDNLIKVNNLKE